MLCSIIANMTAFLLLGMIELGDLGKIVGLLLIAIILADFTGIFTLVGSWLMTENNSGDKHRGWILWIVSGALVGSLLPLIIFVLSGDFDGEDVKFLGICGFSGIVGAATYRMVWLGLQKRFGESWE